MTIHGDIAPLGSLELFRFAEIVMILFGCASYHFAVLGDFDFLYDGFSSFLLHKMKKLTTLHCITNNKSEQVISGR